MRKRALHIKSLIIFVVLANFQILSLRVTTKQSTSFNSGSPRITRPTRDAREDENGPPPSLRATARQSTWSPL